MSLPRKTLNQLTDRQLSEHLGSWLRLSMDRGATWSQPIRVPLSTPHGPIGLKNGKLLYLGKPYSTWNDMEDGNIKAAESNDNGYTWQIIGEVPVFPGTDPANYHEPHVVELPTGRLLGMIRLEDTDEKKVTSVGIPSFSLAQTISDDGGRTWTTAKPIRFHGSPPHLQRHSSGVLVLTYGYRQAPFGQRTALSQDDGETWEHDWIIRDDGLDFDLGYPSSVELADGSLFSVYYQRLPGDRKCSLLWSRWMLP